MSRAYTVFTRFVGTRKWHPTMTMFSKRKHAEAWTENPTVKFMYRESAMVCVLVGRLKPRECEFKVVPVTVGRPR